MPAKRKKPEYRSFCRAICNLEFAPESRKRRNVKIQEFYLEVPKKKHSYSIARQQMRLALLMNMEDFRWTLENVCAKYAGHVIQHKAKLWRSFQKDWQVEITFMPKAGMSLDQFLQGMNKKGQNRKQFYESNIAVWVSDVSNLGPEEISEDSLPSDKNLDDGKFLTIKIPRSVNKQELQDFIGDLPIKEPREYLTTDIDVAIKVLSLRLSVKKTFREIALEIDKNLKNEALKAREETYRKLYTKIIKEIIKPPYFIKRK